MADVQAVQARAAVISIGERGGSDDHGGALWAKQKVRVLAKVVLLPPGVRAAGLGRGALLPGGRDPAGAGLGAHQKVKMRIPSWAFNLLFWAGNERWMDDGVPEVPGPADIPVWADQATGQIVEVDTDTLITELEPQFALGKKIFKMEDAPLSSVRSLFKAPKAIKGFFGDMTSEWKSAVTDMVDDMKGNVPQRPGGKRPGEPDHPPVEGVDYRTWATVKAGLVRDAVHPVNVEPYAVHRGVPPGRWEAVDAAWSQRAQQDPTVQAWAAYDLHRMKPTGTTWEDDPD